MATFLPNVTDVFAGSSDFDPDFNRIERMLNLRENLYQQGAKKVKGLYDSVFNSQMIRKDNIENRDAYLKTISDSLNRVGAMDLSLIENQQTANELFTPIITDKAIVHDIAWTKSYQNENSKAEEYRKSKDASTNKQYWEIGKRALQYQAEEYATADKQTAMSMSSPRYTPQVDMQTIAEKAWKTAGISVKEDNINGGYIWTKKNGDSVYPIAQSYVNTLFSSDPAIQDMLKTKAYVQRKDFVKQNATKFGGEDAATVAYIQNAFDIVGESYKRDMDRDEVDITKLTDKIAAWDRVITDPNKGMVPGSDDHKQYLQDLDMLAAAEQGLSNKKKDIGNLALPSKIDNSNFSSLINQADGIVASYNYGNFTSTIAKYLAFQNAELTVKADPIYLTKLRADLSLRSQSIMEGIRHADAVSLENLRARHQSDLLQKRIDAGAYSGGSGSSRTNAASGTIIPGPYAPPTTPPINPWLTPANMATDSTGVIPEVDVSPDAVIDPDAEIAPPVEENNADINVWEAAAYGM